MLKSFRFFTEPVQSFLNSPKHKNHSEHKQKNQSKIKRQNIFHRLSSPQVLFNSKRMPSEYQQPKPYFKLPKIQKQPLSDQLLDKVGSKVIQLKKLLHDPCGCSKSIKLQKVRLRKKIMGIGPSNRIILQQLNVKQNAKKYENRPMKQEQIKKYMLKVYGQ